MIQLREKEKAGRMILVGSRRTSCRTQGKNLGTQKKKARAVGFVASPSSAKCGSRKKGSEI